MAERGRWFHPGNRGLSDRHARVWAGYEIGYTAVDFAAALLFVVGSALFFREATVILGTWMFLVGSICFALKPTIRLAREVHYWRMGRIATLAERLDE